MYQERQHPLVLLLLQYNRQGAYLTKYVIDIYYQSVVPLQTSIINNSKGYKKAQHQHKRLRDSKLSHYPRIYREVDNIQESNPKNTSREGTKHGLESRTRKACQSISDNNQYHKRKETCRTSSSLATYSQYNYKQDNRQIYVVI